MTLSQLTIIDKMEVIAFCQYSDKLSSYGYTVESNSYPCGAEISR